MFARRMFTLRPLDIAQVLSMAMGMQWEGVVNVETEADMALE